MHCYYSYSTVQKYREKLDSISLNWPDVSLQKYYTPQAATYQLCSGLDGNNNMDDTRRKAFPYRFKQTIKQTHHVTTGRSPSF
jgi:hypothetical protein